jgi:hypothetical protein
MNGDATDREIYNTINDIEIELAKIKVTLDKHEEYTQLALDKADGQLKAKLEVMNGVRDQLYAQAATFMTIENYIANHRTLEVKIEALQKVVWGGLAIVSFLIFAIPILMHFIKQ